MARAADPTKKVIKATLDLAKDKGWRDLTLIDIAGKAKVSLADLRGVVRDKAQILEKLQDQVDVEVLGSLDPELESEPARDRLFEVMMRRFEVLGPHKEALRRIFADLRTSVPDQMALLGPGLRSMQWMLAAAGIEGHGFKGTVQTGGLAYVYASVFQTWLDDDDPGLARTMAALDSKLRSGETWLRNARVPIGLGQALGQFIRAARKPRGQTADSGESEPASN
jgi:AcrR family transcriptional regulator